MAKKSPKQEPAAEWVDPKEIVPWPRNPRKHTQAEIEETARSIDELGFGPPIVARRANKEIIAGHRRHLAALKRETPLVPVRYMDISEKKAHLLALADNRHPEKTEWDMPELEDILGDYTLKEIKMAGWTGEDLEEMADEIIGDGDDFEGEEGSDETDRLSSDFAVIIECESEEEQIRALELCEKEGLKCRALI